MLHCHTTTTMNISGNTTVTGDGNDISVFERQQARMTWQNHHQHHNNNLFNGNDQQFSSLIQNVKPDPGMQNEYPDKIRKRKTHDDMKLKMVLKENGVKEKKVKGNCDENFKDTSSKEKSKVTEAGKQDYIHVRARRGQATDSHSLAERVRREKISERMKYLQDLVPGCNKITGNAGMLDEIINYVQSLQKQVEFLSMKLATLRPRLDYDIDNRILKEMFEVGYSSEMANSTYFQLNSLPEMGNNPIDMMLRRSIGGQISIPETFGVSSCFNQIQPSVTWDVDLQNLYKMEIQQDSSSTIPLHV